MLEDTEKREKISINKSFYLKQIRKNCRLTTRKRAEALKLINESDRRNHTRYLRRC